MKILIIIILVIVLLIPLNVYAETLYPTTTERVYEPPSYCFVKPSDASSIEKTMIQKWELEVEDAVYDWRTKLQNGVPSEFKYLWNLSYLGSDTEPLPNCHYPIYLKPHPDNSDNWYESLGSMWFYYDIIHVYFLNILYEYGETHYWPYYDSTSLRTLAEIGGTTRHEIGHSFGLGHYSTDDDDFRTKWSKLNVLPSIMITGLGTDKDFRQITAIDISKVRAIYGSAGFFAFSTVPIPQPTVPIPQPILPITPIFPIESMGVDSNEIIVDRYGTQYVKVFGNISNDVLLRGHDVHLKITYPDLTEEILRITVGSRSGGYFETTLSFDQNAMVGSYIISAIYLEHTDKSKDVKFKIFSQETFAPSKSQIVNSQPSSQINDDYDYDGILDNNDSCPYDAEIFNGYQDTDGCPDKLPDKLPNSVQTIEVNSSLAGLSITANAIEGSDTFEIIGSTTDVTNDITFVVKSPTGNLIHVDQISPDTKGDFRLDIEVKDGLWFQDGAYTVTAQQGSDSMFTDSVEVEVADGLVVPEFGTIAAMILAVAIISIIAISAKSRLSIVPRY